MRFFFRENHNRKVFEVVTKKGLIQLRAGLLGWVYSKLDGKERTHNAYSMLRLCGALN